METEINPESKQTSPVHIILGEDEYFTLTDEFHKLMSNPFSLTGEEDFSRVSELPDRSVKAIERHASECLSLAERIERSNISDLPFSKQLDLEMAADALRAEAMARTVPTGGSRRYAVEPDAVQELSSLTDRYLTDPSSAGDITDSFLARMGQLPKYLEQQLDALDTPVKFMTEREIDTAGEFDDVLKTFKQFAEEKGYRKMSTLNVAIEKASTEVKEYVEKLKTMTTRDDYSIGHKATAKWFELKGIELSLEEIHACSQEYLEEIAEKLEIMKPRLIQKHGLNTYSDFYRVALELKERFEIPTEEVITYAKKMAQKAEEFAYEQGLVSPLENALISVEVCPSFLRSNVPIAAMTRPGAFAQGIKGVFLINPRKGVGKALNYLNMAAVASHELVPGHMYQLARATEHPSIIRAWLKPHDLCEGWATLYAEERTADLGFIGDPELQLEESYMRSFDLIRLGARANFVLAGLTGDRDYLKNPYGVSPNKGDMFEDCVQSYKIMTGFSPGRTRSDVEIFAGITYGALYLVGNKIMREMESLAKTKQGNDFKQSAFLESILKKGNMPLSYMKRELRHDGIL